MQISFSDILMKKEKWAKEFSEGSPLLYETLLKLWEHGFETVGCCRGHSHESFRSSSYIGFRYPAKEKTLDLLSNLHYRNMKLSFSKNTFAIRAQEESIFSAIQQALDSQGQECPKIYYDLLNFIENYNKDDFLQIILSNQNKTITFSTTDEEIIKQLEKKYIPFFDRKNYSLFGKTFPRVCQFQLDSLSFLQEIII